MGALEPVVVFLVLAATAAALHRLALRLRTRTRPSHVEIAHSAMGVGMCAMHLSVAIPPLAWTVLFVLLSGALGALAALRHVSCYLHHAVGALAMAYMYAAPRDPTGEPTAMLVTSGHHHMSGHAMVMSAHAPGYALPLIAWFLVIYCLLTAGFAGTDVVRDHHRRAAAVELVLAAAMAQMFLTTL